MPTRSETHLDDVEAWQPRLAGRRVLVTGASGFVGRNVLEILKSCPDCTVVGVSRSDCDLTSQADTRRLMREVRPNLLIHLAGLVGGISANRSRPADFFYANLLMGTLVLHEAYLAQVEKIVAAGAGCGYPEHAPLPLKETSFWAGLPQLDSAPYSLAKRMLHVQSLAYWQQYHFPIAVVIPGNIYGPHDNFDLEAAHVVPALVRKFADATASKYPSVEIWGDGSATRDFVYVVDVANAIVRVAGLFKETCLLNFSRGEEVSVKEVAAILREKTNFTGEIVWNRAAPAGQARRVFDVSAAHQLFGLRAKTRITEGLARTVDWYRSNRHFARLGTITAGASRSERVQI